MEFFDKNGQPRPLPDYMVREVPLKPTPEPLKADVSEVPADEEL